MPVPRPAARAVRAWTRALIVALAVTLAVGALVAVPAPVRAAGVKVVIVVGPFGSRTSTYISQAKSMAARARSYGATVYEVYSPNATWSRVKSVSAGARLFIYLGHGNGWPSPYPPYNAYKKNGLGLNKTAGEGNSNLIYYGERYVGTLGLAPGAVVILNHACYTAGSSEPGRALPTRSIAHQRIDYYGIGFFRAGARVVFAEGMYSPMYIIDGLFRSSRSMSQIFWSSPNAVRSYRSAFTSTLTAGMTAAVDPTKPGYYYRSVIGKLGYLATDWR